MAYGFLTLQKLIMQKAAEDLRNEAMQKAAEKEKYINDRVPILKTEGLGQCMLCMLDKSRYLANNKIDFNTTVERLNF